MRQVLVNGLGCRRRHSSSPGPRRVAFPGDGQSVLLIGHALPDLARGHGVARSRFKECVAGIPSLPVSDARPSDLAVRQPLHWSAGYRRRAVLHHVLMTPSRRSAARLALHACLGTSPPCVTWDSKRSRPNDSAISPAAPLHQPPDQLLVQSSGECTCYCFSWVQQFAPGLQRKRPARRRALARNHRRPSGPGARRRRLGPGRRKRPAHRGVAHRLPLLRHQPPPHPAQRRRPGPPHGQEGRPSPVNPAVDSYKAVSIRHGLPTGALDLDQVTGDGEIRCADGSETFTPLGEPDTVRR